MLSRWLRLWFGFRDPVNRGTYFRHGAGLMAFKYGVDALLVWTFAGRFWTPLDYANPLWSARYELLRGAPPWLAPLMVAIALPFVWIGVSMTMRRAVDAGASPWTALIFFVPLLNFVLMAVLSLVPSASRVEWPVEPPPPAVDDRLKSAMLGVAASLGITLVTVGVGIYLRRSYSTGLFLGVPFTIGYISSYIYNYNYPRPAGQSIMIAVASVTIAAGALVVFALEGVVCVTMALPIALAIAFPGAVLGRIVARRGVHGGAGAGVALIVPLFIGVEPRVEPPVHEVVTVVEIAAPPEVVWRYVVSFPDLPPPTEALFRAGVAAPMRARINGRGIGAIRYCDFTTGSFVEPITAWEESRLLAFDIVAQAPPMTEWSPYRDVNPPHLDGYFRATHGEFRLTRLPGGRTRLEGRTAYLVDMFPQRYWTLPAGRVVAAIHERVLRHIAALAEEEEAPMRATVLCTTLAVAAACQPVDRKRASKVADTAAAVDTGRVVPPPPAAPGATRMLTVAGFSSPESVLHDSTQDIYFVSNINGSPTAKDNNGFISRVRPDGAIENLKFIEGGRAGVTLNAPKGLALLGDTLWVTDIDRVRAFNARTGAPVDSVRLDTAGAVFLNDVTVASTGAIYVTDTGIRFDDVGNVLHPGPDRVFRIGPDRKVTVAARGDSLGWPNGITVDPVGKRFIIVSFGPTKSVLAWKPGDRAPRVIAKGAGGFDGVVVTGTRILVSSWTDSTVSAYETGQEVKVITGVPSPADIGYDAKRNRVLIPILTGNRVEIWQL